MSYDLAVWSQANRQVKQSREIYHRLCEGDTSLLQPRPQSATDIRAFLGELTQTYPPASFYTEDTIEECLWNSEFDVSDAHVILAMAYSRADEAAPFISALAYRHNLVCYNPQADATWLPKRDEHPSL